MMPIRLVLAIAIGSLLAAACASRAQMAEEPTPSPLARVVDELIGELGENERSAFARVPYYRLLGADGALRNYAYIDVQQPTPTWGPPHSFGLSELRNTARETYLAEDVYGVFTWLQDQGLNNAFEMSSVIAGVVWFELNDCTFDLSAPFENRADPVTDAVLEQADDPTYPKLPNPADICPSSVEIGAIDRTAMTELPMPDERGVITITSGGNPSLESYSSTPIPVCTSEGHNSTCTQTDSEEDSP